MFCKTVVSYNFKWEIHTYQYKGVFRNQSNIFDVAFLWINDDISQTDYIDR